MVPFVSSIYTQFYVESVNKHETNQKNALASA